MEFRAARTQRFEVKSSNTWHARPKILRLGFALNPTKYVIPVQMSINGCRPAISSGCIFRERDLDHFSNTQGNRAPVETIVNGNHDRRAGRWIA